MRVNGAVRARPDKTHARARGDDGARLLWDDAAPATRLYEKSVAALEAVAVALARHRPLAGEESGFLALHAVFAAAGARARRRVWGDPHAYFWVRRAYQLVATRLGGAPLSELDAAYCAALGARDPTEALRLHLDDFKRFIVGATLLGRRRLTFARPYQVRLPLAIPGTPLAIVGEGSLAIDAVAPGRLHATCDGAAVDLRVGGGSSADRVRLVRAPVVRHDRAEVAMQPNVFALPGFPFGDEIATVPLDYQAARARQLRRALSFIERFEPRTFRTLVRTIRVIAYKPRTIADFANLSHSELPGAIICSYVEDPYVSAAGITHEIHHNRLFLLEDMAPLFAHTDGDAFTDARFYSPWREDLRPLQGILHAIYVYVPVLRYWRAVARHFKGDPLVRDFMHDRLARTPVQLRLGVLQLQRHARFTRAGATLFRALARDVAAVVGEETASPSLGTPALRVTPMGVIEYETDAAGRPVTVRDSLIAHLSQSDLHRQCSIADAGL